MRAATISPRLSLSIVFQKHHCHAAACQNVNPRPVTNQPSAGVIFLQLAIVLPRFFTLTASLPTVYFPATVWQFDRAQERRWFSERVLEAVAADASDNHPQPRATAVPPIPLWVISRHAHAISHHPPSYSPLHKGGHILHPPPLTLLHFCEEDEGKVNLRMILTGVESEWVKAETDVRKEK